MLGLDFSRNQVRAVIALIAVAVIAISITLAKHSTGSRGEVVLREPGSGAGSGVVATDSDPIGGPAQPQGEVVFQVAGTVRIPGLYKLPVGSRITDAINAAGGALPGADLQNINLAAKIEDGARIFVPSITTQAAGAPMTTPTGTPGGGVPPAVSTYSRPSISSRAVSAWGRSSGGKLKNPGDGTVSINSAGAEELQRLPGVGPSTAQKILDYRQQLGRFTSIEQLMDVKGIGPKKLEKIRPFVTL